MPDDKTIYKLPRKEYLPGIGILRDWGDTVPADETEGYATGCIFQHTDGTDATALYVNEGTLASCNFNAVTVGA